MNQVDLKKNKKKSQNELDGLVPLVKTLIEKKINEEDEIEFFASIKPMLIAIKENDQIFKETKLKIVLELGSSLSKLLE